ncbi:unnamed protein product [Chironomus riparius]|uniref:CHK kinase-like domain-containing protein n=1 Tax=Chironomus riparius TaxID=315576 RepID=A0A9P0IMZ7_9DIPT|nr:unnamed protein product [Chironomus riparius]
MENKVEEVPEYLNSALLTKAIQSFKNDETIELIKFEINPAFSEHYASKMYRSKMEFKSTKYPQSENEVLNVVIKTKPVNDPMLDMVLSGGPLFETEMEMYEKVLPGMHQLYERNGMKVEFGPELIYITTEPTSIIILKDLTPDGYTIFRNPPENIEDSKLFIKRLAQFHAASIYLAESNEVEVTHFEYSIYKSENIVDHFFRDTIKAFREVVEGWDGYEDYLPKLEHLIENIGASGVKSYTPNSKGCGFNVLNHGDFHLRNILIKPDAERRIENVSFVDYQLNVWCSPVVDLTYMMGLFKIADNYTDQKAEIVVFYHQELVNALKSIGYMKPPPSLLDVNIELLKHGSMNIAIWINFFPFMFIDWETVSVDDMMANDSEKSRNFKKNLYNSPVLRSLLKSEMRQWMLKGWW